MKANETQSQPNNEPNGFTEIWVFPFGKITTRDSINPKWSHLYCTSEEEYRKIEAEKIKEPEAEIWRRSDRAPGTIISNIYPKKSTAADQKEEHQYYGGWLICESVRSKKDAALISQAPEMLRILESIRSDKASPYTQGYIDLIISKAKGND